MPTGPRTARSYDGGVTTPSLPLLPTDTATELALEEWGPKAGATQGSPQESGALLHEAGELLVGVWECTPGRWPSEKTGVGELMHFVAGTGTITDADGTWEIRPGAVRWFSDGWSGEWHVTETVRKVFAIVPS